MQEKERERERGGERRAKRDKYIERRREGERGETEINQERGERKN